MAKLKAKEILEISYDYETNEMEILNMKKLLVFKETVTENYFLKSVIKWKKV